MTGAAKNDHKDKKSAIEFVHPDLFLGVGNAMRAGEIKYGDWNFIKGHGRLRLCAAIIRHTLHIMKGDYVDTDTSELLGKTVFHWDCICANVNMMIFQNAYGTLKNDLPLGVKEGTVSFDGEPTEVEVETPTEVEALTSTISKMAKEDRLPDVKEALEIGTCSDPFLLKSSIKIT